MRCHYKFLRSSFYVVKIDVNYNIFFIEKRKHGSKNFDMNLCLNGGLKDFTVC